MQLLKIVEKSTKIDYIGDELLINVTNKKNIDLNLNKPSLKKEPWVVGLNNIKENININLLNKAQQEIIIYLNGSKNCSLNICTSDNLKRTNLVLISENINYDENIKLNLNIKKNNELYFSLLVNNINTNKLIDIVVNHRDTNIYSFVNSIGVNSGGSLRTKVNTIFQYERGGCRQNLKIVNLSENVNSECDPVLTIMNNNIDFASHAAVVGSFDQEHLFYLQSKGISLSNAKKLLLESSIRKILDIISNEKRRNFIVSQFMFKAFNQ